MTSIGFSAFYDCSSLMSVSIPDGVTKIDSFTFSGCSGLTSVSISNNVTSIGSNAFYNCSSLTSVNLPANLTSIDQSAFYGCSGLTSINIPAGVTSINSSAFSGCSNLTSVTISTGVTSIGFHAFYNCNNLTSITIPASVTDIGTGAFGFLHDKENSSDVKVPNFIIYGESGSAAETYAKENELTFRINPNSDPSQDDHNKKDLQNASITLSPTTYTYDGTAKTPSVTVTLDGKTLVLNTDYTVSYSNHTNVGTATVTVTGKGNYTGSNTAQFTITKATEEPKKIDLSNATVALSQTTYTYDGKAKTPSVTVTLDGKTLVLNTDYIVSYSNHTNVGTATVTVIGKGNYTGSNTAQFTITKATEEPKKIDLSNATITLPKTSYTYDGKAKKPSVTVKLNGKKLSVNQDYTVSYSNNTKAGTAKVTVTGKGSYTGSKSVSFKIVKANSQSDKITCKKTVYKVAYGAKSFKINASSKSKMTFTSAKPKIAAVNKSTGKVTIKNTGVATITIKAGKTTKKVTVKVSPKRPSVKSAKAVKGKKLTVKWAKDSKASGYQVQISTDPKFQKNVKSKNLSKTAYTFTKLKSGKKYYVRMRSYKKSGKEILYSAWSKTKVSSKIINGSK